MANIKITKEILDAGRGSRNMWNMQQVKLFGIDSMSVSLTKTVIGKEFPEEVVEQFLALRDAHLTQDEIESIAKKKEAANLVKINLPENNERIAEPTILEQLPQSGTGQKSLNVILTEHIIERAKSSTGGWSRAQLMLLGVKSEADGVFKIEKDWKRKVLGKAYPAEIIQKFIQLKDQHLSNKKGINNPGPDYSNFDL